MFINTKYGRTYVTKKGNSKKIPLIGLHGGPGGSHLSIVSLNELSKNRKIILYDQIGSGKSSENPAKKINVDVLVKHLDEVLNKLNIDEFHLFGTSWGATLAVEYYKHSKGKGIRSLILSSPLISEPVWSKDAKKLVNQLPKKDSLIIKICEKYSLTDSNSYKEAMEVFYSKYVFRFLKNKKQVLGKIFAGFNPQIYESLWGKTEFFATGELKGYDGSSILKTIKCPVLLTCGQYDESTPSSNKKFSKLIKNCKFVVVPKASHLAVFENKKYILTLINKFMDDVDKNPKDS